MRSPASDGEVSAVMGVHVLPSAENAATCPAGAAAYAMSTGQGSVPWAGARPSDRPVPAIAGAVSPASSATAVPVGTDPGCHVTVARPSALTTAPARPACVTSGPATAAGTGAEATAAVV